MCIYTNMFPVFIAPYIYIRMRDRTYGCRQVVYDYADGDNDDDGVVCACDGFGPRQRNVPFEAPVFFFFFINFH